MLDKTDPRKTKDLDVISRLKKSQVIEKTAALEPFIVNLINRKYLIAVMPDITRRNRNYFISFIEEKRYQDQYRT